MAESHGLALARAATTVGNAFTISTYAAAGKPIRRVPISTPLLYDFPAGKDFERARRRFLWFGSSGMVHKGLDLVLEAFALEPDLELLVAGPVEAELDFVEAYRRELYGTASIRLLGWLDIASKRFLEVAGYAGAVVYPSSSESGGGSVITCMHAGLVPTVTVESSVDVGPDTGELIAAPTVEGVRAAVRAIADAPAARLEARARAARGQVRARHTREVFAREYRAALRELLGP
jgi:glycosyltransferase involved in cell wall biosynthesis